MTGFVHLVSVGGHRFDAYGSGQSDREISDLAEAINKYTKIRAEADDPIHLNSAAVFSYPVIYIGAGQGISPTSSEVKNFRHYLHRGGFALVENNRYYEGSRFDSVKFSQVEASLKHLVKAALGDDVGFQTLSKGHPIYHSFDSFFAISSDES